MRLMVWIVVIELQCTEWIMWNYLALHHITQSYSSGPKSYNGLKYLGQKKKILFHAIFDTLLTVHLNIFILILTNLMH